MERKKKERRASEVVAVAMAKVASRTGKILLIPRYGESGEVCVGIYRIKELKK